MPRSSASCSARWSPGIGSALAARLLAVDGLARSGAGAAAPEVALAPVALAPPSIEHGVVGRSVVASTDEDRLAGGADLLALADVDERQRPGVVDRRARSMCSPAARKRPPEPDGLVEQPTPIDLRAPRGLDDGGIVSERHVWTVPRRADAVVP